METVIRVAVIYLFVLVGLRILGKREFSQLSPLELINLLLIPELVAQGIVREDYSITTGMIAVSTLLALVFVTSTIGHLNQKVEQVISGKPQVIVAHGQLINDQMNKERITPDELYAEMHKTGLHDIKQIKWAILGGDGNIAIIPEDEWSLTQNKPEHKNVT
jgi:uncharacterized membrane protein YcaP (DUF421 family)